MSITLYDLCGADENYRFSPTCWRTKAALAHKGLEFDTVATPFTKIPERVETDVKTLPYIVDGNNKVVDSFAIAEHLEKEHADAPSLFGGEQGIAAAKFVQSWVNTTLNPKIAGLVVKDIHDCLADVDQVYFRQTREKMFGRTLEEVQAGRDDRIASFREALTPLRVMLKDQPFIGGATPIYADHIVYGSLKWLSQVAPFDAFESDDIVKVWFDKIDENYSGI